MNTESTQTFHLDDEQVTLLTDIVSAFQSTTWCQICRKPKYKKDCIETMVGWVCKNCEEVQG